MKSVRVLAMVVLMFFVAGLAVIPTYAGEKDKEGRRAEKQQKQAEKAQKRADKKSAKANNLGKNSDGMGEGNWGRKWSGTEFRGKRNQGNDGEKANPRKVWNPVPKNRGKISRDDQGFKNSGEDRWRGRGDDNRGGDQGDRKGKFGRQNRNPRESAVTDMPSVNRSDRGKGKVRGVWSRNEEVNPWGGSNKKIKTGTKDPVFQNQSTKRATEQRRHGKVVSQPNSWQPKVETQRRDQKQLKNRGKGKGQDFRTENQGRHSSWGNRSNNGGSQPFQNKGSKFRGFKEPKNFDRQRSKGNLHSTVKNWNSQEKWHFDRKRAPRNVTYIDRSRNKVIVNNYTKIVNHYGRPRNHYVIWDDWRGGWGYNNYYYDGYWPYYGQHGSYRNPFWRCGGPGYILDDRVYVEPIVVFYHRETLPYEWRPYSGASEAVRDIRNAWLESDMDLMSDYISDNDVRVFSNHKYQYTLASDDFYAMTLDAMSSSDTIVMDFDRPDWCGRSEFTVKGRHEFKNQFGDWRTEYLTYRLHRYSGNWYIISLDIRD